MVFFASILIVVIFYYLQTDGLIFVFVIAIAGELINLFMTQTASKATEKKTAVKFTKIVKDYKIKIKAQKRKIRELESIQEISVGKLMTAREKIKTYEKKLGIVSSEPQERIDIASTGKLKKPKKTPPPEVDHIDPETFDDLPAGSNRKKLPL